MGVNISGPYITRLILGMGLLDAIRGAEKIIIPSPLGLDMIILMGLLRRHRPGVYILPTSTPEIVEGEDHTADRSQIVP